MYKHSRFICRFVLPVPESSERAALLQIDAIEKGTL
jgi:hypothetical protein